MRVSGVASPSPSDDGERGRGVNPGARGERAMETGNGRYRNGSGGYRNENGYENGYGNGYGNGYEGYVSGITEGEKEEEDLPIPEEMRVRKAAMRFDLLERKANLGCLQMDLEKRMFVQKREVFKW